MRKAQRDVWIDNSLLRSDCVILIHREVLGSEMIGRTIIK